MQTLLFISLHFTHLQVVQVFNTASAKVTVNPLVLTIEPTTYASEATDITNLSCANPNDMIILYNSSGIAAPGQSDATPCDSIQIGSPLGQIFGSNPLAPDTYTVVEFNESLLTGEIGELLSAMEADPGFVASTTITVNNPTPTSLTPIADSFIQHNGQNQNEGASPFLELSVIGKERALVQFDESQIAAAVGSDPSYTATLQFKIVSNNNDWSTGRQIDVHRMEQAWTEGNGSYDYNGNRGTGSGVTWDCAIDSNIANNSTNCSGSTAWDMIDSGSWPFASTPTATTTITNGQTGTVSFDVTSDVQSFLNSTNTNDGWIVRKDNETQSGDIQFGSKESSNKPVLIITPH